MHGFPSTLLFIIGKKVGNPFLFFVVSVSQWVENIKGKPTTLKCYSTKSLVFLAQSRGFSPRVFSALVVYCLRSGKKDHSYLVEGSFLSERRNGLKRQIL